MVQDMEQLRKHYRIIGFDPGNSILTVYYFKKKYELNIILPIENSKYPEGIDLDNYIMSFYPGLPELSTDKIKEVANNKDYIQSLVVDKHNKSFLFNKTKEMLYNRRHVALSSSDWTQLPDARKNLSERDKILWDKFRQDLRDITQQSGWPMNVEWPKRPHLLGVSIL